jgi:hypothetical protein
MEDRMKEITNITSEGLTYRDDEGKPQVIDFETCFQNYIISMEKSLGASITDEDREFWLEDKYVGIRFAFGQPPAIEFYTEPHIYFEFQTKDDFWKVIVTMKAAGWRTNDGE